MRRQITAAVGAVIAVGLTLAVSVTSAATRASGKESFRGVIVASGESGARTVVTSVIIATGAFTGGGRIVEVANRPGDPENVSRDDLVFPAGTMHIVSTNRSFTSSLNPQTCALTVRIGQTATIRGGTGKFRHAAGTFVGGVRGRGVAARNADGTCSQQGAPLLEVDIVSGHGTLSV